MLKKYRVAVNGETYEVEVEEVAAHITPRAIGPVAAEKSIDLPRSPVTDSTPLAVSNSAHSKSVSPAVAGAGVVLCPMPGVILQVKIRVGDAVKYGQPLLILEAMKMENEIVATIDGTIKGVRVTKGTAVSSGDVLVVIG